MRNEKKQFTKAAGIIGVFTLISRILGFVRDMVIAWFFGAGLLSDAFFVAFRLPNLFRRLFGEGSLTVAFIPVFSEHISTFGKEEAFQMARSAVRMLSVILVFITIIGIITAPGIVRIMAPGFTGAKFSMTVILTRIMFPYIFFICLVALSMGILNVLGHFAAPALAPVFLNLSIIASVLFISPSLPDPSIGLAIGVIIGGILQLLLQLPFLVQKGFYFWQKADFYHPGLKKIGLLMLPAVFGAAVYQINMLIGTLLASFLAEGSISYLYYADRLVQFPLGIFAISMSVAILPSLSRQAAARDMRALTDTFAYAIKLIFFITIPAMTGLIVLRRPIIALLFERGAFDPVSSKLTADALLYFSVGLWAFSAVRIVVPTFYALQDTKTPVKIAIISVLANIVLCLTLMGPLAHGGLALAASLSSMLNFILLAMALRKKLGALGCKKIIESIAKSVVCSTVMGLSLWAFVCFHQTTDTSSHFDLLWIVTAGIFIGIFVYILSAYILRCRELGDIIKIVKKG
ncbi:MAG: murein biosynthesis integral membrane protein MurJ [Desulfobacteraceae bacterium]|nr:murein biosynthesis integral membrane protein MurJ [Desulfobacteraceae bacterium]MBC2756419.1 murein biosynthesis integral membrane protein MurJ [Desulfobacteraceae bacterium]MBC2763549.1 murein biosynthesis integral membrane protein MurJ [ANME-2 cluster archaeon]